ncbi:MAG TPA: signal peptidase I, partial [Acidimicrobiia bacterium]|nr:signal peptidase I [Acidimicrobiia bacterium]
DVGRPADPPSEPPSGPPTEGSAEAAGPAPAAGAPAAEATAGPEMAPVAAVPEAVVAEETEGKKKRKKGSGEKPSRKKQGYEWLILIAASLAVALFVRGFLIQAFYIPSESMVPTLVKNDRVLVNKLSYKLHDVHRGDIVVFTAPPGAATAEVKDLIKRVIGLPGETIEGRNGSIYINNKPLDEPYLPPDVRSRDFPPEKVPPHRVWVLGDNRQDSRDSTFFKSIDEHSIVGRAFVKIWPLNDLGLL